MIIIFVWTFSKLGQDVDFQKKKKNQASLNQFHLTAFIAQVDHEKQLNTKSNFTVFIPE